MFKCLVQYIAHECSNICPFIQSSFKTQVPKIQFRNTKTNSCTTPAFFTSNIIRKPVVPLE